MTTFGSRFYFENKNRSVFADLVPNKGSGATDCKIVAFEVISYGTDDEVFPIVVNEISDGVDQFTLRVVSEDSGNTVGI